jgi:hypothetical protein
MAQTPEGKVKDAVKKILREHGIWFYMPVQNGMGVTGIPDFVCCWHGEFIAIETKAPSAQDPHDKLTANQARVRDEIQSQHGWHFTVDNAEFLRTHLLAVRTYIQMVKGVRYAEEQQAEAEVQHGVPVVARAGEETGDA